MKRLVIVMPAVLAALFTGGAAQSPSSSCVVIHTAGTPKAWSSDAPACATRLSPASTFKIPHALVALETGVIQPDTVEKCKTFIVWRWRFFVARRQLEGVNDAL